MKKILITALCIFLFLLSGAQSQFNIPGIKRISETVQLENGKYASVHAFSHDTSTKFIMRHSGKTIEPVTLAGNQKNSLISLTLYHVVFHFDQKPWDVLCNQADTMFSSNWNMNWINNTTIEAWMPEGYYDVLSCFFDASIAPMYVFVKDFHVNMNRDTTISSTSANHKLSLHAVDENNVLLPNNMKNSDALAVLIEYPPKFKSPMGDYTFAGWDNIDYVMFSNVRPDIKIYTSNTAMLKRGEYHRYEIYYPVLMGFTHDTTLSNDPADYGQYRLIYNPTPAVYEPYFVFGYGDMNNCLLGTMDYILISMGSNSTPSKPTDTVRLFSCIAAVDTNKYLFCHQLGHCEFNPMTMWGFEKDVNNYLYYTMPGNILVQSSSGKYPPVSGDYLVGNGMTVGYGNTAPYNSGFSNNTSNGFQILITPWIKGQVNEHRGVDEGMGTYDIFEEYYQVLHDSLRNSSIIYGAGGPFNYTVILNDSNWILCGMPGYLRAELHFNLGWNDANPPRMRSFQVLMGDSVATNIIHGFPSSVLFTAGDWIAEPGHYYKVFHHLKEAHLYYKEFSQQQWLELNLQSQPQNLDSITGMPYIADLEQVMNQYPDSAFIDLKIELTDSTGNKNNQTMHPAFLVRDLMTGIKPAHNGQSVFIYPDPATDRIHIGGYDLPGTITIFTSAGQPVLEVTNTRDINVSDLNSGLYIVRIKNHDTGRISYVKFIR